jgi:hypothetical protein
LQNNNSLGPRTYSPLEWENLTLAQHQEIYRQRRHLATARTMAAVITESLNWNQGDDVRITTQIMEIMQIGMVVIPMPQTTLGMREQQCRLIVIISVKHLSVDAPQ